MEIMRVSIGNRFYIDRIEHLSKKDKKHVVNALSIYCNKKNYTQAIIEHLYNAGLSGAVTVRMKVQENEGIHIGVFKVDYYKNILREKESFDKIKATGGTGSSLFMNIESVDFDKKSLMETDYKAVIEYTAADGLSETITDLRSLFYRYYTDATALDFTKDFSRIIHNIFVSNFGLNGVLYSNQKYSNKYYDIHFDRKLQRPPREVFGAEWPAEVFLDNAVWVEEESISKNTKIFYFKENIALTNQMLSELNKGERYLFRIDFIKYDVSDSINLDGGAQKKHIKFIIPGKYRLDINIELDKDNRHRFFNYIEGVNILYINGEYIKNKYDILKGAVEDLGYNAEKDKIAFSRSIHLSNMINKVSTFLDNPLLKVFMECLAFNDPNYNNILISDDKSVKIIDYALISQNGLYYDLSRFEIIMKMEFYFDILLPKYSENTDLFYKTVITVEEWALSERDIGDIDKLDKDVKFLYIFTLLIRYYMVEMADMHYLHTFNEFKSGSFLREYLYSLMFFTMSFLKFKHDPPERKKLAFMLSCFYAEKLEKSGFVSSARLNEKVFKIKKSFSELFSKENKHKVRKREREYNPNKFSIEMLLSVISSGKDEQISFFENIYKIKSANRLLDDFLENYFGDYESQMTELFITLSKRKSNHDFIKWLIKKLNAISSGKESLKLEILDNTTDIDNPDVKKLIIEQLYNLTMYDFKKALRILLKLTANMDSRTLVLIIFILRCRKPDPHISLKILSETLVEDIPLSLKFNILDFVKKYYYENKTDADKIINYLSTEINSRFRIELGKVLQIIRDGTRREE